MVTSPAIMTDKLGRRSGPRRTYTIAEKRSMVEETEQPGASVPEVAHRHAVNANLLSVWRRQYRQGVLTEAPSVEQGALLPVKVSTPTVLPSERASVAPTASRAAGAFVEIEFEGGRRLRIRGRIDRALIKDLIAALSSR
jgi:transposase